jgi:hypothetical protein
MAGVGLFEGQPELAGRLLGAADHLRNAINSPIFVTDIPLYERTVAGVRAALGAEAFAAARAAGAALPLEQAVRLALSGAASASQAVAIGPRGSARPAAEGTGADV